MIEVKLEDGQKLNVENSKEGVLINDILSSHEIIPVSNSSFKVLGEKSIYNVELIHQEGKEVSLSINNKRVNLEVADHIDQILEKLGMDAIQATAVKEIKAPMPGTILDIMVEEGDEVKANDQILVLEAMKMENVIKSPGDGVVSRIHVSLRQNVEKSQVLISFE